MEDENIFLSEMQKSYRLHYPWVQSPQTSEEFKAYIERNQQSSHKSYLIISDNKIAGVFNISEIVRGFFQSAYLGFYAGISYASQGYMKSGLKIVLQKAFKELNLHRLEANIQPENICSIHLIQSAGFSKEGFSPKYLMVNNLWRDHERWSMTVEDWEKWCR